MINPLTGKVGFSSGYRSSAKLSFAGTGFNVYRVTETYSDIHNFGVYAAGFKSAFRLKSSVAAPGKTWNSATTNSSGSVDLGNRFCFPSNCVPFSPPTGDVYRLFRFKSGGKTLCGWLEYAETGSTTPFPGTGPNVNLIGMAWDPNGNKLPAGRAPAPSSIPVAPAPILAGIATLILGAEG